MARSFFNPYKFRRKLKRRSRRVRRTLRDQSYVGVGRRRDFAFGSRKRNPMVCREFLNIRQRLYLGIIIVCFLGGFAAMLYSPQLKIDQISVTGLQRIEQIDFTDAIAGVLADTVWYVLPGENYFLVNTQEVEDILAQRYPLATVIVKKEFPNTLSVLVEEKLSTLIYDNAVQYGYVGLDGKLVELLRLVGEDEWVVQTELVTTTKMVTTTNDVGEKVLQAQEIQEEKEISRTHVLPMSRIIDEMGDFPLVYDTRQKEIGDINNQVLKPERIAGLVAWYRVLNSRTDIPVSYFIIHDELGNGVVRTKEGWELRVVLDEAIVDEQFARLELALREEDINRPHIQYIDLRFDGRLIVR